MLMSQILLDQFTQAAGLHWFVANEKEISIGHIFFSMH
jgi:hypothetical protein